MSAAGAVADVVAFAAAVVAAAAADVAFPRSGWDLVLKTLAAAGSVQSRTPVSAVPAAPTA